MIFHWSIHSYSRCSDWHSWLHTQCIHSLVLAVLPAPRFGIADAWRAARGLAAGDERLDLDGNGTVDARDADRILARIVDLDAPRRNS